MHRGLHDGPVLLSLLVSGCALAKVAYHSLLCCWRWIVVSLCGGITKDPHRNAVVDAMVVWRWAAGGARLSYGARGASVK